MGLKKGSKQGEEAEGKKGLKSSVCIFLKENIYMCNTKRDHNHVVGSIVPGRKKDNRNILKTW